MQNHHGRKHAYLSASGSSRWLNCTASPELESSYPDKSSTYADEGTLAHELSEITLQNELGIIKPYEFNRARHVIQQNELYSAEMPNQVAKYVDIVLERVNELRSEHGDKVHISIEERLDFSEYVPGGFGTGDVVIVYPGGIDVIDLKYGKGVPVYAEENSQLKLYGLGALAKYGLYTEIEVVNLHVLQPRLDSFSSCALHRNELVFWGNLEVKPIAETAAANEGETVPGDWCRWCRAKATCKALADRHLELARFEFADPKTLTDDEILEVYGKLDLLNTWTDAVKKYVYEKAINGYDWEGYKLVAGRSNRKWSNPDEVIKVLRKLGFHKADYTNEKIKGIQDISNLMSLDDYEEHLQPLIVKPEGKPTLVDVTDKRPAINDAAADFGDENDLI